MAITLRMYFLVGSLFVVSSSLECADQSKTAPEKEKENKRSKAMVIAKASNSLVHPQPQPALAQPVQASPGTSPDVSENSSAQSSPNGSPLTSPGSSPVSPRHQAQRAVEAILYHEWPFAGNARLLHRIDSPVNHPSLARPIARQGSARDLFPGK